MNGDYISALIELRCAKRKKRYGANYQVRKEIEDFITTATTYILRHAELIESRSLKEDIVNALLET